VEGEEAHRDEQEDDREQDRLRDEAAEPGTLVRVELLIGANRQAIPRLRCGGEWRPNAPTSRPGSLNQDRYVIRPSASVSRTTPGSSIPSNGVFAECDASDSFATRHRAPGSKSTRSAGSPASDLDSPMTAAGLVDS